MNKSVLQSTSKIILLVLFILLLGSIFLYKQRMLFVDPCFITFNILNTHSFVITEHRYGAFITQIVPLIGAYLHLPLKIILLLYSASFYVFYLGIVLILIYRLKQYGLAILMAFYFTLFVSDVYFWPNNEVHQGVAWMFLFLGLILSGPKRMPDPWFHTIIMITAFLAIFSHFIVMLPLSFLWLYFINDKKDWNLSRTMTVIYSLGLLVIFFIKFQLGIKGWYDGEKLQGVTHLSISSILSSFSNGHAKTMYLLFMSNYWIVVLILLAGLISLLKNKRFILFGMTVLFTTGYFILICITFPSAFGRELLFYMESQWMALGIIISAPFVYHLLPQLKSKYIQLILIVIFSTRLMYIGHSGVLFNERLNTLESTIIQIKNKGYSKIILTKEPTMDTRFLMNWGLPVESLTLSAMNGDDPIVTFKVMRPEEIINVSNDTFLSSFRKMGYGELNPEYFRIDTMQAYQIMSYGTLFDK